MKENEEIRIARVKNYYEIELHDESLTGDTLIKFKSADTVEETLQVVRELLTVTLTNETT